MIHDTIQHRQSTIPSISLRTGSMPSSSSKQKNMETATNATATTCFIEFKSVLRIRPLLKKERDDPIALEALDCGTGVALHPPVLKDPTADAGTAASVAPVVVSGHDVEFRFDRALSATASQDKVYAVVGQPTALQAMEALKTNCAENNHAPSKTHLIIGMGLATSGTTYTCIGGSVSKRKLESDALVPRILDSLFSQSKHHHKNGNKKASFAVKITILQLNQSKTNPSESQLYDLLQPVPKAATSAVEQLGLGINSLTASLLHSMDLSNTNNSGATSKKTATSSCYVALNEPVIVQQDPVTSECFLVNATQGTCLTAEEARDCLQTALHHCRQLSHKKCQSHVLVQFQPVIISSRSGRTLQTGETVAVLDMASCDISGKQRAARLREQPNRADAHTAVMHVLKAIQYNQAPENKSLRKVPFLQHKVTMLLQPLLSAAKNAAANVTLLVTASPSNRDYVEKKVLLNELLQLHSPAPVTDASTGVLVATKKGKTAAVYPHQNNTKKEIKKSSKPQGHRRTASDADDEASKGRGSRSSKMYAAESAYDTGLMSSKSCKTGSPSPKHLERAHSMTYSDSRAEEHGDNSFVPLPPPVAPGYKERHDMKRHTFSPQASAPIGEPTRALPPITTVDFPGVPIPLPSTQSSSLTDMSSSSNSKSSGRTYDENNNSPYPMAIAGEHSEQPKFSYMKTINKVVHASKKKGRKVMERMTVTTISSDNHQQQLQQRVSDLEQQNAVLLRENAVLAARNKQLLDSQLENMGAKSNSSGANQTNLETVAYFVHNAESKHDPPRKMKVERAQENSNNDKTQNESHALKIKSQAKASDSSKEDRRSIGTSDSGAPDHMYDNPLFRHMATMNNQSSSSWNRSGAKASVTHCYEKTYDLHASFSGDSNDENDPNSNEASGDGAKALFDDPLLQHMAMMNNL